jgi:solute carrier family 35 protein F5
MMANSFLGVIIVSLSDSESKQPAGPASHPKPHQTTVDSRATLGDILALISALFYAMYVILLKVRIKSESRIDMQLFFGFVGLFNILTCWPIGLVLHLTGIEIFESPPSRKVMTAVLVNVGLLSTIILSFFLFTFIY